jgi:hypothetical protein
MWLMPAILAIWEEEIVRIMVWGQPWKRFCETHFNQCQSRCCVPVFSVIQESQRGWSWTKSAQKQWEHLSKIATAKKDSWNSSSNTYLLRKCEAQSSTLILQKQNDIIASTSPNKNCGKPEVVKNVDISPACTI